MASGTATEAARPTTPSGVSAGAATDRLGTGISPRSAVQSGSSRTCQAPVSARASAKASASRTRLGTTSAAATGRPRSGRRPAGDRHRVRPGPVAQVEAQVEHVAAAVVEHEQEAPGELGQRGLGDQRGVEGAGQPRHVGSTAVQPGQR